MGDHAADPTQAIAGARGNYMLHVRTTRRAFIAAFAATACFTPRVVLGIAEGFQSSPNEGWANVFGLGWVLLRGAILVAGVALGCWMPARIRVANLKRRLPDATFFLLRNMPSFWARLSLVDLTHSVGGRIFTDTPEGRQYVGKADDADSIRQRWDVYAVNGYGGNVELRNIRPIQLPLFAAAGF